MDDDKVLLEIKQMLSSSSTMQSLKKTKSTSSMISNTNNNTTTNPSPYDAMPSSMRRKLSKDAKKAKANKQKLKTEPTNDELLTWYASQPKHNLGVSSDDIIIKNKNIPYSDTIIKIQETLHVVDYAEDTKMKTRFNNTDSMNSTENINIVDSLNTIDTMNTENTNFATTHNVNLSVTSLRRRYARLLENIKIDDSMLDTSNIRIKSDVWLAKWIEECYDEAYKECSNIVRDSRRTIRCGLELGSMDAFPSAVMRILTRTYSVLELRIRTCIEILYTLERQIQIGSSYEMTDSNDLMINGGRALLFTKFLSEEYDLAYLAIFLQCREITQKQLYIKLKDLNPMPVWINNNNNDGNESPVKVPPIKLPALLRHIPDITMPEAPIVGFDTGLLPSICNSILSNASLSHRAYLMDTVLNKTRMLIKDGLARKGIFSDINKISNKGIDIDGAYVTPIHTLLVALVDQWTKVPAEIKNTFGKLGETSSSLRMLNTIYDNDCEMRKNLEQNIRSVEAELSNAIAIVVKLEKAERRLSRKWKEGTGTEDELLSLPGLRVQIEEARTNQMEIEAKAASLLKEKNKLTNKTEDLWESASASVMDELAEASERENIKKRTWKDAALSLLSDALSYNEELVSALSYSKKKLQNISIEDEQESQLPPPIIVLDETPITPPIEEPMDEISLLIKALESETTALAAMGSDEALDIGIVPVIVKDRLIRQEEEEAAIRENDIQVMIIECGLMADEEQQSHKYELELEKYLALKEKVEGIAKFEIDALITNAVKDISEATLLKRLDELIFIQNMEEEKLRKQAEIAAKNILIVATSEIENVINTASNIAINAFIQRAEEDAMLAMLEKEEERKKNVIEVVKNVTDQFVYSNIVNVTEATLQKILEQKKEWKRHKDEMTRDFILNAINQYSSEGLNRASNIISTNQIIDTICSNIETAILDDMIDFHADELNSATLSSALLLLDDTIESCIQDTILSILDVTTDVQANFIFDSVSDEVIDEFSRAILFTESGESWKALDLDPESWLMEEVLYEVEERFIMSRMLQTIALKRNTFRKLLKDVKVRKLTKKTELELTREVWTYMMNLRTSVSLKSKAAVIIQGFAKLMRDRKARRLHAFYLSGLRERAIEFERSQLMQYAKYLMADWRYRAYTNKRIKLVKFALKERRMMICYFTWKLHFKHFREKRLIKESHHREKAIIIQCLSRKYLSKKRVSILSRQVFLIRAFKMFIARKRVRRMKEYRRRQLDVYLHLRHIFEVRELRKPWANWRRCFRFVTGFKKSQICVNKKKMRKRFAKWKTKCQSAMVIRNRNALLLQKTVRMWVIKRYVLDYYRWNRALRKMQGLIRRKKVAAYFEYAIYYYRRAKLIQKMYRGYRIRSHITEKRISDLHYAAYHNNYDRLQYYVKKFPELVTELDSDGNTALHNAARSAARRTMKLLMRHKLDPNALNLAGYSALHLTIMSTAVNRDDCCIYMLDRGFDEEQFTPDGKSCLLLAIEYGRGIIVKQLLKNGLDPNIADHSGLTCLQSACRQGLSAIVNELIDHGADVNAPGYCGTYPLHDCLATGNIDIANLLFRHGAYVNVTEPYQNQTPLMWACYAGLSEIVMLYLEQGANVFARDYLGWTAVHHGACSNSESVYNVLRMGDAHFEEADDNGNYPLHIATSQGSVNFVRCLLEGLCNPTVLDKDGNQAAHLAARDDNVEILELCAKYDEKMSKENYNHQTPLGIAKYHNSRRAMKLLNDMYGTFEQDVVRNSIGEVWWDKHVDEKFDGWSVIVTATGERSYYNENTGETSVEPPSMSASDIMRLAEDNRLPVRKRVAINKEDNKTTKHGYQHEFKEMAKEIHHMSSGARCATIIGKWMRRKLAYKELKLLKKQKKMKRILARFVKKYNYRFKLWKFNVKVAGVIKIQKRIRGFLRRSKLYWTNEYNERWDTRNRLRLRIMLWKIWLRWRGKKTLKKMKLKKNPPKTLGDWQVIIDKARFPNRKVGAYEEYVYPGEKRVYFYRHSTHGECSFDKPKKMELHDKKDYIERKEIRLYGCTLRQKALATKLQALWRGYYIRSYYELVEKAMEITTNAEAKYMDDPDNDVNLYNHALHCFAILSDHARARALYIEALRRMEYRGPDIAFILYSYCVFAFVTHDQDYADILMLLERARKAEEVRENQIRKAAGILESLAVEKGTFTHGKIFELANVGFFRYAANSLDTSQAWHNYAVCRFLIFNHFNSSFDAFLNAFKHNPRDKLLKANFDTMMEHFHGRDKDEQAMVVRKRMRFLAEKDEEIENERRAIREESQARDIAVRKIQRFVKAVNSRYGFKKFMEANKLVRDRINNR